jgi:cobalamin synthase
MPSADTLARCAAVAVAVAVVLVGAPTAVTTTLVALAAAAVVHGLVRRRARGAVDAVLVGIGGLLSALVVVGVVTSLVGVPLRTTTWAPVLGVLSVVALLVDSRRSAPPAADRTLGRGRRRDLPWFVAAVAVVAVAVGISVESVRRNDIAPIAMSIGVVKGTQVQVHLSSDESAGPFELRTETGDGNSISYPLVSVAPGQPADVTVQLPVKGRYVITLNNPRDSAPVRTLTVDR